MRSEVKTARVAGIRAALIFLGLLAGLFAFGYATSLGRALNDAANVWTSSTCVSLLRAIGVDAHLDGTYIHTSTFSVYIVDACNGFHALWLVWAACLSTPARWRARGLACCAAVPLIATLNQVRLVIEMLYGSLYPETFAILEEGVMRIAYAALSLLLLYLWADRAVRPSHR